MLRSNGISYTHKGGHILDLIISRQSTLKVYDITTDYSVSSDHWALLFHLSIPKPTKPTKVILKRNWKGLNTEEFAKDIKDSSLWQMDTTTTSEAINTYNTVLKELLDKHAPGTQRQVTIRHNSPWYNQKVRLAKQDCKKSERHFRTSGLTIHWDIYKQKRNVLHSIRDEAKKEYFTNTIHNASPPKVLGKLFSSASESQSYPQCGDSKQVADSFADYFAGKIDKIRSNIRNEEISSDGIPDIPAPPISSQLSCFSPVSCNDVIKLIANSKTKHCDLDPVPTKIIKDCKETLAPIITTIINTSLASGDMPGDMKQALVTPLLKKASLDPQQHKNFRPVSNLSYVSKLVEKVVARELTDHLDLNGLTSTYQSAYKALHSTETALTRVHNDIMKAVDSQGGAILVLLDLSAAFDTIDHSLLLDILENKMGICDIALAWLKSYLSGRSQTVVVSGCRSEKCDLPCGVPQGSVLGPLLFSAYTTPLCALVDCFNLDKHMYADDSSLYVAFRPTIPASVDSTVEKIQECARAIKCWMSLNFLKLNEEKTEVLVITTPTLSKQLSLPQLQLGESIITPSEQVRDLGVNFDSTMKLEGHVRSICRSAYYHLHNIYRIRNYIDEAAAKTLVQWTITSRLDYCNGLLYGISSQLMQKLQRIQNTAARLITGAARSSHITPYLIQLHWLPVHYRVRYKIILTVFKALNGLAPEYITALLTRYTPHRQLRSQDQNLLVVPDYRLKSFGGRSFSSVAPRLWNELPQHMRKIDTLAAFKVALKTHLFKEAYEL